MTTDRELLLRTTASGIDPLAPGDDSVTPYDARHFLTYARLLDAEAGGVDWRDVVALILGCDVAADADAAWRCWDSHLARARWIAGHGYAQLLARAGLPPECR